MKTRIMYIEPGGGLAREGGRICRIKYSKTMRSIYFDNRRFESLKGDGYKENFFDVETGERYWISGPRKDGNDALYPMTVEIDEDIREEYWVEIRNMPEQKHVSSIKCPGKYSKRNPQPELNVHGNTNIGGNRKRNKQ